MIGNDLVDLNQAKLESNWERKGYFDKIFSETEQQLIVTSSNQNEMVWTLWSMKESAYKIHNKRTGVRSFAPVKLICSLNADELILQGRVSVDDCRYFTQTQINKDFIHTIASCFENSFLKIKSEIYSRPHPKNYKKFEADCISHHGRYLALVYDSFN